MLGDKRLTHDDEVAGELASTRTSLRFVRQLAVDDAVMHMFRDAQRAKGGIRLALWDQTLTLDASSMGLLCATEVLRSVAERAGK